jgi:hypothetical protein
MKAPAIGGARVRHVHLHVGDIDSAREAQSLWHRHAERRPGRELRRPVREPHHALGGWVTGQPLTTTGGFAL